MPEGFCVRLMERLERESERRERRETWLLGTAGVLCLLAVDFPAESRRLSLFYVFIAATFLALAGLDLCLRRRRHNAAKTNAHPHR